MLIYAKDTFLKIYWELSSVVEQRPYKAKVSGSTPLVPTKLRSVAQPGSALALGARGPRFESLYSDHFMLTNNKNTDILCTVV